MRNGFRSYGISILIVGVVAGMIVRANRQERRFARDVARPAESSAAPTLSREGLQWAIERQRAELHRNPANARAAVSLADALLRQARVSGNAGLALEAEQALKRVLHGEPLEYEPRRMLGAVYLSQHRFREAILE